MAVESIDQTGREGIMNVSSVILKKLFLESVSGDDADVSFEILIVKT